MDKATRLVTRTVRNGHVKINHRWFAPDEGSKEYDGCFDGHRYVFGLYWTPSVLGWFMEDFVSMWGSERYAQTRDKRYYGDIFVDNGSAPWIWWREVKEA